MQFSTEFTGTENPLCEMTAMGCNWKHNGALWTKVQKIDGVAHGTQDGDHGYDDSYAYLKGSQPANMLIKAHVYQSAPQLAGTHELELLLRWSDGADFAKGYEINFMGGSVGIVRWEGGLGQFTEIRSPQPGTIADSDEISAKIVGGHISAYINGVLIAEADDSTYPSGSVGIGFFYRNNGGALTDMGLKDFSAVSV